VRIALDHLQIDRACRNQHIPGSDIQFRAVFSVYELYQLLILSHVTTTTSFTFFLRVDSVFAQLRKHQRQTFRVDAVAPGRLELDPWRTVEVAFTPFRANKRIVQMKDL